MNELTIRQAVWKAYQKGGAPVKKAIRSGLNALYYFVNLAVIRRISAEQEISTFRPDSADRAGLRKKLLRDCRKYRARPDEFFLYHFDTIPEREKPAFLMDNKRGTYTLLLNEPVKAQALSDKGKAYELFRPYYGRELLYVTPRTDDAEIESFVWARDRVIVKKADGCMGKGIEILEKAGFGSAAAMREKIRTFGVSVVEDVLVSEGLMRDLHPQSLNTIRVPTFLDRDGRVTVFHPFLRVGKGDSVVDNAGSGGLFANIDASTGVVLTDAVDKKGHVYKTHPDSGFTWKGLQIPRWDELLALADRLARVLPTVHFIGFDLALTKDGWVMVEGNRNPQPVQQMVDRVGLLPEFEELMKKI